ncbi:TVP38/TMEM64 family protein [Evansella cellulosilytica]|uniref:TVP38/TMEM64 family membrane protein n=1 Tax=Evansella cellulosilytica (strain ATCC 21833 / DSM 2522 / FERM P-1141 / JCM 9156 / N-4) TaxID=649639 RepID=E6U245_EVAC2|nr:VTT domain-containing protein [Evansella cellulosilytica]ADU30423.1 SNARE associated Golgi protein-related protein [Evansella cellulosilytica DSM 2522]
MFSKLFHNPTILRKLAFLLISILVIILIIDWEWITYLRQEDISYFTDYLYEEIGYQLLWITLPLMIVQGVVTIFPILVVILIHFISFGLIEGFIFSFLGTFLSSIFCYLLTKSFSGKWIEHFWNKRKEQLERVLRLVSKYGILVIIVLRSIPIMPSNIISVAAALSPITTYQYIWSSIIGNISMIWLLSLISAPFWIREGYFNMYLSLYIIFSVVFLLYFSLGQRHGTLRLRDK